MVIIFGITVVANDIIINTLIIFLFVKKLFKLLQNYDQDYHKLTDDVLTHQANHNCNNMNMNDNSKINSNSNINNINSNSNSRNDPEVSGVRISQTSVHSNNNSLLSSNVRNEKDNINKNNYDHVHVQTENTSDIDSINNSNSSSIMNQLNQNKREQKDLINLMSKILLLTIASVIVEQLFTILATFNMCQYAISNKLNNKLVVLSYIFRAMEGLVNCIVLYFTFIFSENEYFIICGPCHHCLRHQCSYLVGKKMVDNFKQNQRVRLQTKTEDNVA